MEITKQYLIREYLSLGKSQKQIAKETGFSQAMICIYMQEFDIKPRKSGRQTVDLSGQIFGKLTVVSRIKGKDERHPTWECSCECGGICFADTSSLKNGSKTSCPKCGRKRIGDFHWKGNGEISGKFWSQIKWGASVRNLCFDITPNFAWDLYLKQNKKCALTGVDIVIQRNNDNNASLDRIDSSKPYLEDNVQWVHKRINWMKGDMTEPDLLYWSSKVVEYSKGKKK